VELVEGVLVAVHELLDLERALLVVASEQLVPLLREGLELVGVALLQEGQLQLATLTLLACRCSIAATIRSSASFWIALMFSRYCSACTYCC